MNAKQGSSGSSKPNVSLGREEVIRPGNARQWTASGEVVKSLWATARQIFKFVVLPIRLPEVLPTFQGGVPPVSFPHKATPPSFSAPLPATGLHNPSRIDSRFRF